MTSSPARADLGALPAVMALHAVRSLHCELVLYPKPGLVSLVDNGSHHDMTAATFVRSLAALRHFFKHITAAGFDGADFARLSALGMQAEAGMLRATGGVNTHRGAIFCLGLLCAAIGRAHAGGISPDVTAVRVALLDAWGTGLQVHRVSGLPDANGTRVAMVHAVGGARAEAAAGMPSVFEVGLPALRRTLHAGRGWECARIDALFTLLATVDDTNLYHRGGSAGAALARAHGQRFMDGGGTANPGWRRSALASHRLFVERRLSPGGIADLLAATCLVHNAVPEIGQDRARHHARDRLDGAAQRPGSMHIGTVVSA